MGDRYSITKPSPTLDNYSHKDYIVYVADALTDFTAASGITIEKTTGSNVYCHLRLFVNEAAPNNNFHFRTCNPEPSSTVVARVQQSTNDLKTRTGNSNGYAETWTFTAGGAANPPVFGAAVGSSTNNLNLYSSFSGLKVRSWTSSVDTDFSAADGFFKCEFDSGYKYDQNTENAFQSGPPTVSVDECSDQIGYEPRGEWL